MWTSKICLLAPLALAGAAATPAYAQSCVGSCGTLGADGVVTESPIGGTYQYVSTSGGVEGGASLGLGEERTGSLYTTTSFTADVGSNLQLYFNYVTTDGAGYADYAFVLLRPTAGDDIVLFTARTTEGGDTVPGFEMPPLAPGVTLNPGSTPIIAGAPTWSPVGSGCWATGCGYTDWIQMNYSFNTAGTYALVFGVTNWSDTNFQSGLAFDGLVIDDTPIGVPEPASWAMMIAGFAAVGSALRRRKMNVVFA